MSKKGACWPVACFSDLETKLFILEQEVTFLVLDERIDGQFASVMKKGRTCVKEGSQERASTDSFFTLFAAHRLECVVNRVGRMLRTVLRFGARISFHRRHNRHKNRTTTILLSFSFLSFSTFFISLRHFSLSPALLCEGPVRRYTLWWFVHVMSAGSLSVAWTPWHLCIIISS